MAQVDQDEQHTQGAHFVATSIAEALVPIDSSLSVKELFESQERGQDENDQSLLPWVRQREVLFLDEDVHALIVLKTALFPEDELRNLLRRTAVSVELCATGITPGAKTDETRPQQVRDVLSETVVNQDEEPFVVASSQEETDEEACLFVIWKIQLPLNRPRVKLQKLAVYLAPTVMLKPLENTSKPVFGDHLLPSMVAQPINLLQPFEADPRFVGQTPYLSASRVTKVAPAAPATRDLAQRLITAPRRVFKAGPALFWRIRFSKCTAPPKTNSMFATLEFEVPQLWQCDVSITKIKLSLDEGEVDTMGPDMAQVLRTGDQFTVLFKLTAPSSVYTSQAISDQLLISITAIARLSSACTPTLNINWTTTADFSFDQQPDQAGTAPAVRRSLEQSRGPDSLPYDKAGNLEKPVTPFGSTGISITVSGPDKVIVGNPFTWTIFFVNRSDRVRSFAVFPMSRTSTTRLFPPAITPLRPPDQTPGETNDIYDMPISWFFEPSALTCMTSRATVGPLASSACGTTELRFGAMAPGLLHIEAVRVVDLATRKTWDVRDLPDIFAELA